MFEAKRRSSSRLNFHQGKEYTVDIEAARSQGSSNREEECHTPAKRRRGRDEKDKPNRSWMVFGALFLVQLINASYNVMAQGMLETDETDPVVFSLLRDALAWPIMHGLALAEHPLPGRTRAKALLPAPVDAPRIVLQGVVGVAFNQVLILHEIRLTGSMLAGVLTQMVPVFAALGALLAGSEQPKWRTAVGLALATGGAILLVGPSRQSGDVRNSISEREGATLGGVTVLLLWCVCMAVYYIIQKPSLVKYTPLAITAWEYMVAVVLLGAVASCGSWNSDRWQLSSRSWMVLVYCVLLNSVAKYPLSAMCNKRVSVTMLTCWSTLTPILTALLSVVFLKGDLHTRYLASIPVILGTYLISVRDG